MKKKWRKSLKWWEKILVKSFLTWYKNEDDDDDDEDEKKKKKNGKIDLCLNLDTYYFATHSIHPHTIFFSFHSNISLSLNSLDYSSTFKKSS